MGDVKAYQASGCMLHISLEGILIFGKSDGFVLTNLGFLACSYCINSKIKIFKHCFLLYLILINF